MLDNSLLGVARLAGELLVDGGGVAEEGGLAGLQVDGDGDVVGVVHGPALDELQAGLHRHAGRLEVKVRVPKRLVPCSMGPHVTPLYLFGVQMPTDLAFNATKGIVETKCDSPGQCSVPCTCSHDNFLAKIRMLS